MSKLDDLLTKKKDTSVILDLSKTTASTKEEFRKLFEKVPDFKIKPEKIRSEDIKLRDKDFKFKTTRRDFKFLTETYNFMDPLPPEMRSVNLSDLAPVPIDWKMLTMCRPKTKLEEEMFTRLVDLAKLELQTRTNDKKRFALEYPIKKVKNKAGVVETRPPVCIECGEEFCNGKSCVVYIYDGFSRVEIIETPAKPKDEKSNGPKKVKKKKKIAKRTQSKSTNKRSKSKSPEKKEKSRKKSPSKNFGKKK